LPLYRPSGGRLSLEPSAPFSCRPGQSGAEPPGAREGSVLSSASAWPSCVAPFPPPSALCFLGREGSPLLSSDSGRMEYKRGFAVDICRMSARTPAATAGRPGPCRRLFQVQTSLKPVRCHRITVAGWTTETASVQPLHRRDSRTQNSRSAVRKRGRAAVRWRTASWCRNARFSSTRECWVLTPRRRPMRMRVIMPAIIDQAGRKSTLTRRTE
jgi:hypothetical protein